MWSREKVRSLERESQNPARDGHWDDDRDDLPGDALTEALVAPDLVRADAEAPMPRQAEERGPKRTLQSVAVKVLATLGLVLVISIALLMAETADWLPRFSTSEIASVDPAPESGPSAAAPDTSSGLAAEALEAPPEAPVEAAPPPGIPGPDVDMLVILIRSTVLALNQANLTGDYSVLRELAAPRFQAANTADALAKAFTDLRERGLDLSTVAVVNPVLDGEPVLGDVDGRRMMRLTGAFPGASEAIVFDMIFEQVDGRWLLFGLGVNPTGRPSALPPPGPAVVDGKPVLPPPYMMMAMIRDAVVALGQANRTGNYNVLSKMSAPGFREANSIERLGELFAALRGRGLDLAPVTVIDPGLYRPAAIMENGMMRLTGYFPSQPERVNFDLAFQYVEGRWKLFGIGVNTSRDVAATTSPPVGSEQVQTANAVPASDAPAAPLPGAPTDAISTSPAASTPPSPRLRPTPMTTGSVE
jgi:hypothetical protein